MAPCLVVFLFSFHIFLRFLLSFETSVIASAVFLLGRRTEEYHVLLSLEVLRQLSLSFHSEIELTNLLVFEDLNVGNFILNATRRHKDSM